MQIDTIVAYSSHAPDSVAGWCYGHILSSHATDQDSIPGCGRSASHQTVSGTASAGDAHSLVRRTNPPTDS